MTTITEAWVVTWFPPDAEERQKAFKSEEAARRHAATDDVAEWNPILEHRLTESSTTTTVIPL